MWGPLKLLLMVHLISMGTTKLTENETANGIQEVVHQLIKRMNQQETTMKQQQALIENFKGEITHLKTNVDSNSALTKTNKGEIVKLKTSIDSNTIITKNLNGAINHLQTRVGSNAAVTKKNKDEINHLKTSVDTVTKNLNGEIVKLKANVKSNNALTKNNKGEIVKLKTKVDSNTAVAKSIKDNQIKFSVVSHHSFFHVQPHQTITDCYFPDQKNWDIDIEMMTHLRLFVFFMINLIQVKKF